MYGQNACKYLYCKKPDSNMKEFIGRLLHCIWLKLLYGFPAHEGLSIGCINIIIEFVHSPMIIQYDSQAKNQTQGTYNAP